jgi:hypothetical protein
MAHIGETMRRHSFSNDDLAGTRSDGYGADPGLSTGKTER